ncbi:thiamine phosphate synthase [Pedococcus sp. NPDC057267]|uniref:thiamine phosphate synthase n=1 Tax=Pedococcus sp. NPDC057267 TaxID=3346077 RepID=UPI003644924E
MTETSSGSRAVPRFVLLTDRHLLPSGSELEDAVGAALEGGVDGVVVRERDLAPGERARRGSRLRALTTTRGALFSWAAPVPVGGGDGYGVHLRADDAFPAPRPAVVGRSCHSTDDLRRAAAEGCDYVTLSPVAPTRTKPGYGPALGPHGLQAMLREAGYGSSSPRVLALGGIHPELVAPLLDAGAHGIAVMGSLLAHDDIRARAGAFATSLSVTTGRA